MLRGGENEENEIILGAVLQGFYEAVASLLSVVDKKAVLENLDLPPCCWPPTSKPNARQKEGPARTPGPRQARCVLG